MNNYVKVNPENMLNVIKTYIEINYGYENASVKIVVHKGYSDFRDYEPDKIEAIITANKDLNLGIGISEITITLDEKDISGIIMKKLAEQNVRIDRVEYEVESGTKFTGTKIHMPVINNDMGLYEERYKRG
jgi:hypothetical protein